MALRTFYGPGHLDIDWPTHAAGIRMTRCDIAWRKAERRSTRTGQRTPRRLHRRSGLRRRPGRIHSLPTHRLVDRRRPADGVGKGVIDTR